MTQKLCKNYQEAKEEETKDIREKESPVIEEKEQVKEMNEMLIHIKSTLLQEDDEEEDYFSEDEFTVIKAYYENELEDEQEELETKNLILFIKEQLLKD